MNKYEIIETIGQGEYGVVLKAKNKQTAELVAIKKFKQDDSDQQNKRVILRQVKILKTLNHQNIIELKQAFRKKCRIYLVCEYVDKNLLQLIEKRLITSSQLKNYAYQIIKGIAYMHSLNIVHRDIKPENVLISKSDKVKICDLGFARNLPTNGKMTDYVATRWYRPPELILGRDDYEKSIDIWAVGCVMAEMIDGEPLFGGQNDLDQLYLIQKCLGPLTPQHQQFFLKNPKFIGMKFPEIHTLETIQRRYFGKIDKLGLDLLKKMLKMQPTSRITAQQALNHPYFSRSSSQSQIQFRRNNWKQQTNFTSNMQQSNLVSNKAHLPMNNFINDNASSRQSKQEKMGLNKVTGFSKLKKNQQPTQIQQYEDFPPNTSIVNKAKSLGKKNGASSIRQKTAQKYGKNSMKNGKSNFNNNFQQRVKVQEKQYEDNQDDYYEQSWQKQEPETSHVKQPRDYRQKKNSNQYPVNLIGNDSSVHPNSWINGTILQGILGAKSKSKQKMHTNRGYAKQVDSPTKQQTQKMRKNFKNIKKQNISIVFNNNTYNLNLMQQN